MPVMLHSKPKLTKELSNMAASPEDIIGKGYELPDSQHELCSAAILLLPMLCSLTNE